MEQQEVTEQQRLIEFLRRKELEAEEKGRFVSYLFCTGCSTVQMHRIQEDEKLPGVARLACFDRYRVSLESGVCWECCDELGAIGEVAEEVAFGSWHLEEELPSLPSPSTSEGYWKLRPEDVKAVQAHIEAGGLR